MDPIEVERRVRERHEFVESLFLPVMGDFCSWNMEWLVQDLIPLGYLVMLAGPPKAGKTCFATALALSVANGLPFAGRPVQQGAVLWISAEESPRERHLLLNQSNLVETSTPLYTCFQRLAVDEERTLDALRTWVLRTEAKLLVVDPFIACAGHSLTDSWAARRSLQELKNFASMHRITVLVLHHQKRDIQAYRRNRVADNAQLAATASMNIVLSSAPIHSPLLGSSSQERSSPPLGEGVGGGVTRNSGPNPKIQNIPRLVTLDCYGRGEFANQPIYLVSHGPLDFRPTQVEQTATMDENPRDGYLQSFVLKALEKGPRGSAAILDGTPLNPGALRNAITNLRRKGRIKMISIGKNKRIYALVDQKKPDSNEPEETNESNHDRMDDLPDDPPISTQKKKRDRQQKGQAAA